MIQFINSISSTHHKFRYLTLLLVCLLASCSSLGVQPWERDLHAESEMAMDADSLDLSLDEHIYFSREASSGGQGFAGGGCGCN